MNENTKRHTNPLNFLVSRECWQVVGRFIIFMVLWRAIAEVPAWLWPELNRYYYMLFGALAVMYYPPIK